MKNFKKIFFVFAALFVTFRIHAQFDIFKDSTGRSRTLVRYDVDTSGEIPKFGPNRLFYLHGLSRIGEMAGPQNYGLQTNWWSYSILYGFRMKLKLWSWESVVMDLGYHYDRYSLRMDTPRLSPLENSNHQREKIVIHNFSGAICDRINFGRRGNVMGLYPDLGVYGDYGFYNSNVYVNQYYVSNSPSGYHYKVKTKINRLPYLEKFNYGLTARIGGDYGGIFVLWRWNDLIKQSYTNIERDLPKLTVGIEVYWD